MELNWKSIIETSLENPQILAPSLPSCVTLDSPVRKIQSLAPPHRAVVRVSYTVQVCPLVLVTQDGLGRRGTH